MQEYKTKEYKAWVDIRRRCYDPKRQNYKNYGARGIRVADEWRNDYYAFLNHVGRAPDPSYSLDRIDSNGNYEPGNVKWSTPHQQQNNKSTNMLITINGETKTIAEWSREVGISDNTIGKRIKYGWTPEEAVLTPLKK